MNPFKKQKPKRFYPEVKKSQAKPLAISDLNAVLEAWDKKLSESPEMKLIACGSTALALMGYKTLTQDVEFLVPDKKEYGLLILFLKEEKYRKVSSTGWQRAQQPFIFNLYSGKQVYSMELLNSPLQSSGNQKIQQWKKIYLGVLNPIDLIISKMFRGNEGDIKDSRILFKHENINGLQLQQRCRETALYDLREKQVLKNLEKLLGPSA